MFIEKETHFNEAAVWPPAKFLSTDYHGSASIQEKIG
jgi:hypothetical protein